MQRAMNVIYDQKFSHQAEAKIGHSGKKDDLVTSADKAAQEAYLRMLRESLPEFGIIAEEANLVIKSRNGLSFTLDPLDGTKAFARRQSDGVGTMVSLVDETGNVLGAWIGDVNTGEIFYYRPGSKKVHQLVIDRAHNLLHVRDFSRTPLRERYVMLREVPAVFPPALHRFLLPRKMGGFFANLSIGGGSIGTMVCKLFKDEVGAVLLTSSGGKDTPWDFYPIYGLAKKLGFVYLAVTANNASLKFEEYQPPKRTARKPFENKNVLLVIHRSQVNALRAGVREANAKTNGAAPR
jgi:fructose-1,6-bisphosphatase/inositol monophosphatase family enzyme